MSNAISNVMFRGLFVTPHQQKQTTTAGSVANHQNNDPIFKQRDAATSQAVNMFGGPQGADGHQYMAIA